MLDASEVGTADPDGPNDFGNPFARGYDEGPGWLRLGLQAGSVHRDGIGPRVTFVPWEYVHLTATYGYRTDHSFAGILTTPLLPRAMLSPYLSAGYALAIGVLPQGLKIYTHQLVAGLGLEARILSRYVLGVEVTGNGTFKQILEHGAASNELGPSQRLSIHGGFHFGLHLP